MVRHDACNTPPMAAAGAGFRGGDQHPRGQVAVGGSCPSGVVGVGFHHPDIRRGLHAALGAADAGFVSAVRFALCARSEEHTSELQSLMRISYAVFCLKKKTKTSYHIDTM